VKTGDPRSVRHLRPDHMPSEHSITAGISVTAEDGTVHVHAVDEDELELDSEPLLMQHTYDMLEKLRAPFDPELIEHLPRQKWKKAWEDQPSQTCDECGGYHPSARYTIHLDYVGHAGVTSRLLEVDPLWEWEPLAYTEQGLPQFDQFGGLWIKLTVCGVTRLGYGDATGKQPGTTAVKEIIGDAIRNAAMRFGVALDLWSKADLHSQKNPGAIEDDTPRQTSTKGRRTNADEASGAPRQGVREQEKAVHEAPRAANQDALDELLGICDRHGLDTREVEARYNRDFGPPELVKADSEDIRNFGAILIAEQEPESVAAEAADSGGDQEPDGDAGAVGGDREGGPDPLDGTKPPDDDSPMF